MNTFNVFGLHIPFLGLMTAVGFVAALIIANFEIKRKGLNFDKMFNLIIISMIAGIVGARLFFILFYNPAYYFANPLEMLKIYEGGLSIHGGIVLAIVAGYVYSRKSKQNFLECADTLAPGIILAQGIARIGCDVFGRAMQTPLFWGVKINGQTLHPAQVYEFLLDYIVFFILWRKRKNIKYNGQLFVWYIILFALNRGIVELFRINPSIWGWFSVSHLLSVVFIIFGIILMLLIKKGILGSQTVESKDAAGGTTSAVEIIRDILMVLGIIAVSLFIYYSIWS